MPDGPVRPIRYKTLPPVRSTYGSPAPIAAKRMRMQFVPAPEEILCPIHDSRGYNNQDSWK